MVGLAPPGGGAAMGGAVPRDTARGGGWSRSRSSVPDTKLGERLLLTWDVEVVVVWCRCGWNIGERKSAGLWWLGDVDEMPP